MQHDATNMDELVSQTSTHLENDENVHVGGNMPESTDIEFQKRQIKLLETITKNSVLTMTIVIGDITYAILFAILFYEAEFDPDLWFITNLMLYFTAGCDLTALVLGFVFSKKYYKYICGKSNELCGVLCHILAKQRVKKAVEQKVQQETQHGMELHVR